MAAKQKCNAAGLPIGIGVGVALGIALKNWAVGIGVGIAIGVALLGATQTTSGTKQTADDQSDAE